MQPGRHGQLNLLEGTMPDELLKYSLQVDGRPLNFFRLLGWHPPLLQAFARVGARIRESDLISPRLRELAILRTSAQSACEYEFAQHAAIGMELGIDADEINATRLPIEEHPWESAERLLLQVTDELLADADLAGSTWDAMRGRWDEAQVVELILLIGSYRAFAMLMNVAALPLDTGVSPWPEIETGDAAGSVARDA